MQGVVGYSEIRNIQTGITSLKVMVRNERLFSDIESRLIKEKLKVLTLSIAEPTLEDVYIKLVGKGFAEVEEKPDA